MELSTGIASGLSSYLTPDLFHIVFQSIYPVLSVNASTGDFLQLLDTQGFALAFRHFAQRTAGAAFADSLERAHPAPTAPASLPADSPLARALKRFVKSAG